MLDPACLTQQSLLYLMGGESDRYGSVDNDRIVTNISVLLEECLEYCVRVFFAKAMFLGELAAAIRGEEKLEGQPDGPSVRRNPSIFAVDNRLPGAAWEWASGEAQMGE